MKAIIISIDEIKETLPNYNPVRAEEFHVISAKLADKQFEKILKETKYSKVILVCGGSASGKTEYIHTFLENESVVIFDSTLSSIVGAKIKISKILKGKKSVEIHFILPIDIKSAFAAFLGRERQFSSEIFFRTHSGARTVALWIAKNYPKIILKIIESRFENNKLKAIEVIFSNQKRLIEYLKIIQYTSNEIRGQIL